MPDRFNRKSSGDEKALMRRIRKEAEAVERRLEALTVAFLGEGEDAEERAIFKMTAPYYHFFDFDAFFESMAESVSGLGRFSARNVDHQHGDDGLSRESEDRTATGESYSEAVRRIGEDLGPQLMSGEGDGVLRAVRAVQKLLGTTSRDIVVDGRLVDDLIADALIAMAVSSDKEFITDLVRRNELADDIGLDRAISLISGEVEQSNLKNLTESLSKLELKLTDLGVLVEEQVTEKLSNGAFKIDTKSDLIVQVGGEERAVESGNDVLDIGAAASLGQDIPGFEAPTFEDEDERIPIEVPLDFSRTLQTPRGLIRGTGPGGETFEQAPRYFSGDEYRIIEGLPDNIVRALQADLVDAGLLNPLTIHGGDVDSPVTWNEDSAAAFRVALGDANFNGTTWSVAVDKLRTNPLKNEFNTFSVDTFEAPDPDFLAQSVKSTFRQILGREPGQAEIDELSAVLLTEEQAAFAQNEALRRSEFERDQAALRGEVLDQPEATTDVDATAGFLEEFDRRYQPELQRNTAQAETRDLQNSFRSMFTNTRNRI